MRRRASLRAAGASHVRLLAIETIKPGAQADAPEVWLGPFGDVAIVVEMTSADLAPGVVEIESVAAIIANGLQHPEPRRAGLAAPLHEALVDERGDPIERVEAELAAVIADGFCRLQGPASGKDREAREERPFRLAQ